MRAAAGPGRRARPGRGVRGTGTSGSPRRPTPPAASATTSCSCGRRSGTAASSRPPSAPTGARRRCWPRRSGGWASRTTGPGPRSWPGWPTGCTTSAPTPSGCEISDRSVAMARGTADRRTLATVLLHRCWALDGPGDVDDALRWPARSSSIGAELGDPELRLEGLRIRLAAQFEKGGHSAAVQTADEMKDAGGGGRGTRSSSGWPRCGTSPPPTWRAGSPRPRSWPATSAAGSSGSAIRRPSSSRWRRRLVAAAAGTRGGVHSAVRGAVGGRPGQPGLARHHGLVPGRGGRRDRAAELLRRMDPRLGGGGGQELPVVGGDRGLLRRRRPGRRPAVGARSCTIWPLPTPGTTARWGWRASSARPTTGSACWRRRRAASPRPPRTWRPRWPGTATWEPGRGRRSPRRPTAGCCPLRGHPADVERAAALAESAMRTAEELGLAAISRTGRACAADGARAAATAGLPVRAPGYVGRGTRDPRVHVDGGPGPDDRVEVGVSREHLPLVVALGVAARSQRSVLSEPAGWKM